MDFFDEKEEDIAEEEVSVAKQERYFVTTRRIWQGIHKDFVDCRRQCEKYQLQVPYFLNFIKFEYTVIVNSVFYNDTII